MSRGGAYLKSILEVIMDKSKKASSCGEKYGSLPSCAPLSVPFVPAQTGAEPVYAKGAALSRGTLFPGLDLPWKNVVNTDVDTDTPLGELMALCFVINELGLYLDTHADDREALELYTGYVKLMREGMCRYTELYGPLEQTQITQAGYTWLDDPWPWDGERTAR